MPGAGTHTTVIQRLAKIAKENNDLAVGEFLTDPDLNADWSTYSSPDALQSRYAILGAMGPDIFYAMLDYGGEIQDLEDMVLKVAGTFRCAGELSSRISNLIDSELNELTLEVWEDIQAVFANLKGIMVAGVLDVIVERHNLWTFFLPLRQVDDYPRNWYWADFLHYVKTGCFTQKLLDNAAALRAADPESPTAKCLSAYTLGYLTHYVADTVGHGWVNRIVESPWRNMWQRHHLVENFIDAHVWASWHNEGTPPARPADGQNLDMLRSQAGDPLRAGAAGLSYARLNDLCNIGSPGTDSIIDNAVTKICNLIQRGLFDIGASSVPALEAPDDPIFTTWTEFMADAMWQTYPPGQDHPSRMGRYPTPDDVAGAYSAYRLVLSLATGEKMDKPMPPDSAGDLSAILDHMWRNITNDLSRVPPPPSPASSGSFSLEALWDAVKAELQWLGQVADAALQALGDLIGGLIQAGVTAGADIIKSGLYLLNSILYSIYHSLRMTLVMSGYSGPFTEDLTATWGPLDLSTLWNTSSEQSSPRYPIEPVLSQRDLTANQTHPFSPYRPYFKPSGMAPVNVESPATIFPAQVLAWTMPEDMLDSPVAGTHDMFSAAGPAPATTVPLLNPDGSTLTNLETFDGSQRYFGSIMANCEAALLFAVPYLSGTPYPQGVVLPDYNLDSDRGYAWPCWDVDWTYMNPLAPFPWNGCDPYPIDTLQRVLATPQGINWGADPPEATQIPPGLRQKLTINDPWGSPRSGNAWVNAAALGSPSDCQYASFLFPSIVINPTGELAEHCVETRPQEDVVGTPGGGLLSSDYLLAPPDYLHSNPADDLVNVYLTFPYAGPTTAENDRRLSNFLRALARTADPRLILANAVSLWLGGGSTALPWEAGTITSPPQTPPDRALATAVAQLAVTGRRTFGAFASWKGPPPSPPDDADVNKAYNDNFPTSPFAQADIQDAATHILDAAYTALWAIRSNDPGWRRKRITMPWIAVSGFDDTPHRPVNVPTAPYPQHDLSFTVQGAAGPVNVTTRYMIASAGAWAGPWQPGSTSFTNPDPKLLGDPPGAPPAGPAPRTLPQDNPVIDGSKIIIYIHGGGSKAEEAVDMANWFIIEGQRAGEKFTVISFDLPNSAYGSTFEVTDVTGTPYDYNQRNVLHFVLQYVIAFIEALDATIGNVKDRIVAVMGGSLGGNTSLLLTGWYDPNTRPYLRTIVSWSVTATAPANYLGIISAAELAAYVGGLQALATKPEPPGDHATQAQYFQDMYTKPLSANPLLYMPPQPVMWFRSGYPPDGTKGWQPCKDMSIARSRFDRYEIYSPYVRRWITALNLEQISFSFQDDKPAPQPDARLMLVAGDNDNYFPNAIYNSTVEVARAIRQSARGKAEFWLDTGHSIHSERPHLFVKEILYFLAKPDAGDSPNGTVVSTPPRAAYSMADR
ncbi:MAG: zinc dependent phospholipase C family protein [Actinomycetes bacterium]